MAVVLLAALTASAAETTIIHAGRLLAIPGEAPLDRRSIVIEGDRIARVVDGYIADTTSRGDSARVVDLRDAFVMPGLIDGHVHLASAPGESFNRAVLVTEAEMALTAARHARLALQAGFTTVVDLGTSGVAGHENAIFAVRDAARSGELAGPRVIAAGTPISATSQSRAATYRSEIDATIDDRAVCDGAEDCRRAVRHQVRRGSDIIVFFNTGSLLAPDPVEQTMTPEEMRAIVETAHALGRKVIADGHHARGVAAALRAGADIVDSVHLYDDDTFALIGPDQFLQSHIYGVVQAVGATRETLHDGLWGFLPADILRRFQAIRLRPFAMTAAYRHGIRNLAYASDAGVYTWGENAGDLVEFVSRGMSTVDAIRTATINAARSLGLDSEFGSIAPGLKADIIAVERSPLDDISAMLDVSFVMRDGRIYRAIGASGASGAAAAFRERRLGARGT